MEQKPYKIESCDLEINGRRFTGIDPAEVFTSPQKPGVVLVRQGRYSIQLDELEREALKQMNRKERRIYTAEHRKVARTRHR